MQSYKNPFSRKDILNSYIFQVQNKAIGVLKEAKTEEEEE